MRRREFITTSMALLGYVGIHEYGTKTREVLAGMNRGMPLRRLGKTDTEVSLFSLGGESLVEDVSRQKDAVEVIHRAIDLGVNYLDTAPSYGRGGSETNLGEVMKDRRKEVFLATKTGDRTYDGTMRSVEESLTRLQTDTLDLYQIHNIRLNSDLEQALSPNGAIKALEKLKSQDIIRFTGITGHKDPEVLHRGITEYDFDCLLIALNAADIHYTPFQLDLLKTAVEKEMGIIAMKTMACGRIFHQKGITSAKEALYYVFSLPISTAIVGISNILELEENVKVAKEFSPFSKEEMKELEEKTRDYEQDGNFFKYSW